VELPANLIFTREGLALLSANPNAEIKRVSGKDGSPREGMQSKSYNAPTIQKMIMNSYLEEIYIKLPDLLRKRHEIISTNNLIVYAILYKKLSPSLARMLFESTVVKEFNRKNPKNSIVDLKHISMQSAAKLVESRKELFLSIKKSIQDAVLYQVSINTELQEEDRTIMARSIPKFIDWIDNRIWYLYFIIHQTPLKEQMQKAMVRMITQYLDHTRIGTHLSNLLMEFVQNAEKAHFERLIIKNNLAKKEEVDTYLRDRGNRQFIIDEATRRDQMLEISWSMASERGAGGRNYRIIITVSNYGLIDERTRSLLHNKMKTNVDGIGLASFYEGGGDADKLGAGLGLLYNSYLEDLCRKEGIFYKTSIFPEMRHEKTTVQMELAL